MQALAQPETQKALKLYGSLWIPPVNKGEKLQSWYQQTTEKRADLFSLRQLLKLGEISPALNFIDELTSEQDHIPIVIKVGLSYYPHPSDIERALYTIGFLVAHSFDIAALINAWEQKGICISGETAKTFTYPFVPPKAIKQQIEKAYTVWKKKKLA